MLASRSGREVEIKLPVADVAEARRRLRRAGFRARKPRIFESNVIYDTADGSLRRSGQLLRVRRWGPRALLTYKGPPTPGRHKSREELEMELPDADRFAEILTRLGYKQVFRYEKYRTEYVHPGATGIATLDETPIGNFLEIEGQPEWIDQTAGRLGFAQADYIILSYAALYLRHRDRHPADPPDMVFR